jgi:predicted DNA-binding transcriptional regulator AlpA
MSGESEPLLDIRDVAKWVGIPVASIYQYRHRREGIGALAIKVGAHLRWRPEDIRGWLEEQAQQAKAEALG